MTTKTLETLKKQRVCFYVRRKCEIVNPTFCNRVNGG